MGSQSQAITQTEETFREVFRKGVYDVIIAHLPGLETSANDACRFAMMAGPKSRVPLGRVGFSMFRTMLLLMSAS